MSPKRFMMLPRWVRRLYMGQLAGHYVRSRDGWMNDRQLSFEAALRLSQTLPKPVQAEIWCATTWCVVFTKTPVKEDKEETPKQVLTKAVNQYQKKVFEHLKK